MENKARNTGIAVLAAAAAGAVAAWVIRDQMKRHSRDLFSSSFFRRLAALGYMAKADATVDHINLMKDFVAWESRAALRRRAQAIVERMERDALGPVLSA
ncbi:MAG: hypothetical protein IIC36_02445 [Gemmatimonadetes bacterium]|jgi:hypothetical protein|nr:hypothetical protein [Gemmatimonadota bacterium]